MRTFAWTLSVLTCLPIPARAQPGDVVLAGGGLKATLGADGAWRALAADGRSDLCPAKQHVTLAHVRLAGKTHPVREAKFADGKLTLRFAGCDTVLTFAVAATKDWLELTLTAVCGARPDQVALRVPVAVTEHIGPRLNAAWDDKLAVCLRATSLQVDGRALARGGYAELTATTQDAPGPKLEGSGVALLAAAPAQMRRALHRLSLARNLPTNFDKDTPSKDLPLARGSYWFLRFGQNDVGKVVDLCRRTGFRQVMMSSGSWCRTVGHYTFRKDLYPQGLAGLRKTVAALHDAGILVGMHCFASKVSKTDAYVTPVPDRRFWVDRSARLAEAISADQTTIRLAGDLRDWPGSGVAHQTMWEGGVAKHREIVLDDEIVQYAAIGPAGKWDTLLDCRRGAWGTRASPHKAGALGRHYGVDGCINGYIVDQETSLLDETTDRLAGVFNECGFDMVYFDGGEDVDRRRFNYYVTKFQAVAMAKFRKRPLIHMGTIATHGLWHSFTRSGTVDTYMNTVRGRILSGAKVDTWPTVRDHVDRSVAYMLRVREDMLPGELGWFGIWPRGPHTDGLQPDEVEYLMAKSLAYDAPISLQTSFSQMAAHPLTPTILDIVRAYDQLRVSGKVSAEDRELLKAKGKDFLLLPIDGDPLILPASPAKVGDGRDVRAMVSVEDPAGHPLPGWPNRDKRPRAGADAAPKRPQGSPMAFAAVWHIQGREGSLILKAHQGVGFPFPIALRRGEAEFRWASGFHVKGSTPPGVHKGFSVADDSALVWSGEGCRIPMGSRRTVLLFARSTDAQVRAALATACFEPRKPVALWIPAADTTKIVGQMAEGSKAGVTEPEALSGDVVLCTGRFSMAKPPPWYAEYRVKIPHKARWTLWARVRYPTGGDMSFGLVLPGEPVTLTGRQVLGNCGRSDKKWHWTGRGGGMTTVPPGRPVTFALDAGEFVFRLYPREGPGTPAGNPRLDCFCLADDPTYRPTDPDARAAMGED